MLQMQGRGLSSQGPVSRWFIGRFRLWRR